MFELLMLIGFAYAGFCHLPGPVRKSTAKPDSPVDKNRADRRRLPHRQQGRTRKSDTPQAIREGNLLRCQAGHNNRFKA